LEKLTAKTYLKTDSLDMECMCVHFITDALWVFPDFDDIIAGLTINTCLSTFIHLPSDVDSFRPS